MVYMLMGRIASDSCPKTWTHHIAVRPPESISVCFVLKQCVWSTGVEGRKDEGERARIGRSTQGDPIAASAVTVDHDGGQSQSSTTSYCSLASLPPSERASESAPSPDSLSTVYVSAGKKACRSGESKGWDGFSRSLRRYYARYYVTVIFFIFIGKLKV